MPPPGSPAAGASFFSSGISETRASVVSSSEAMDEAVDWMTHCRAVWDDRFARLDQHLAAQLAAGDDTTRKGTET